MVVEDANINTTVMRITWGQGVAAPPEREARLTRVTWAETHADRRAHDKLYVYKWPRRSEGVAG